MNNGPGDLTLSGGRRRRPDYAAMLVRVAAILASTLIMVAGVVALVRWAF